jgi:hypothetical protein
MYLSLANVGSRMRFVHCRKHNSTNSVLDKLTIPQLLDKFPSLMDLEGPLQCRPQVSVFKANKFSPQHTIPPSFFRIKDWKSTKHEALLTPEIMQVRNLRIENGIYYCSAVSCQCDIHYRLVVHVQTYTTYEKGLLKTD